MRRGEHSLQIAVARQLNLTLDPEYTWWSAIDHGAGKLSKTAAGMMKARGVRRGLPDIIVLYRMRASTSGYMFGIELKSDTGKYSDDQRDVGAAWIGLGYTIYGARSLEDVQDILTHRAVPMRHKLQFFGGGDAHERAVRLATARHSRPSRRRKSKDHLSLVQRRPPQEN